MQSSSEVLSSSWPVVVLGGTFLFAELVFWLMFHFHMVPKCNELRPPQAYRAPYQEKRHLLLRRIVQRICSRNAEDHCSVVTQFLLSWFRPVEPASSSQSSISTMSSGGMERSDADATPPGVVKLTKGVSTVSSSTTSDTSSVSFSETESSEHGSTWTIPGIYKRDMDDFLAWALFAKRLSDFTESETAELDRCYKELADLLQLEFIEFDDSVNNSSSQQRTLEPRRLSLEQMNPWHRPFAVYLGVLACQWCAGLVLHVFGFRRVVSKGTGLTGWYRAGGGGGSRNQADNYCQMPLLFFHGIAPAGLFFYLPMLLFGLARDSRPCFLFDNHSISCRIGFDAVTEMETVAGVQEIVEKYLPDNTSSLAACGHSFGSCQLTWLLLSSAPAFRRRIRQYVLMDPVTILLSDPDVMINFLYSTEVSKIRMVASSELFTEYYLRRHFAWYNSELWLNELLEDDNTHAIIALSDADEIVNSPKVKDHIDLFARNCDHKRLKTVYWRGAGHASCVTDPRKWREIRSQMLQSELELLQQQPQ